MDNQEKLLIEIDEFLNEKGMNYSKKKTKVTKATHGFDLAGTLKFPKMESLDADRLNPITVLKTK
jgi:hypothetical protein